MEKIKLKDSQRIAIRLAREKANNALEEAKRRQGEVQKIVDLCALELGIKPEETWKLVENDSFFVPQSKTKEKKEEKEK